MQVSEFFPSQPSAFNAISILSFESLKKKTTTNHTRVNEWKFDKQE